MRSFGGVVVAVAFGALAVSGCPKKAAEEERTSGPPVATRPGDGAAASSGPTSHEDETEQHEQLPTTVQLRPEVVQSAGIKTAPSISDSLPATVDLTGEIATDPDRSARLAARVSGRIVEVKAKEGDRVKAGQIDRGARIAGAGAGPSNARFVIGTREGGPTERRPAFEPREQEPGVGPGGRCGGGRGLGAGRRGCGGQANAGGVRAGRGRSAGRQRARHDPHPARRIRSRRDAVPGQTVTAEHVIAVVGDLDHALLPRPSVREGPRARQGRGARGGAAQRLSGRGLRRPDRDHRPPARSGGAHRHRAAPGQEPRRSGEGRPVRDRARGRRSRGAPGGPARGRSARARSRRSRSGTSCSYATRTATSSCTPSPSADRRRAASRSSSGLRDGEQVVVEGVFTLKSAILKGTFGEEE